MTDNETFDNNIDFEQMLENSLNRSDHYDVGEKITGTIIQINKEYAFIDISGKSEAIIELNELLDKDENLTVEAGDTITAYVLSFKGGEITLTTKIGSGKVNNDILQIAYDSNIPIDGMITEEVNGGYRVLISGIRCFCPFSQISLSKVQDPKEFINQKYAFKIIKFAEQGRNIVLSRKVLLMEVRDSKLSELKESLNIGDIIDGEIISIQKFGVFIDIGGAEALIPKSEISFSRYADLSKYKKGNSLSAKVISIDWNLKKIALSLKALEEDPWSTIDRYKTGERINGKIVNLISAGAFVEIEPGLEGFIHVSKMSFTKKINKPEDAVSLDDIVNVKFLNINPQEKKISLELITDEADPWQLPIDSIKSEIHTGIIEISKKTGLNVRLENGMSGFVPKTELSSFQNNDIQKDYPVGSEIELAVKDINQESKKLILSQTMAIKNEISRDYNDYVNKNNQLSSGSLGNQFQSQFENLKSKIKEDD
jgi:small subunit ribosomal protein S1